jgi:hypothetical protein
VPETDVEIDVVEPAAKAATRLEDLPPPPVPEPGKRLAPKPPAASAQSTAARPAVQAPVAAPAAASGLRKPVPAKVTDRRQAAAAAEAEAPAGGKAPTGLALPALGLVLVLLPVGGMLGMLAAREKLAAQEAVTAAGARLAKGMRLLLEKLSPAEAPAPKPEAPKPAETKPEAPVQPTAEDRERDNDELNKLRMEYKREERTFKQKSVGATPAEKAQHQSVEADLKKKAARIEELKARFQKIHGQPYNEDQ